MNHFVRRIIFWSFFLIFIVLTFYFSLLAGGYSISFSSLKPPYKLNFLQKTGILAVDSSPREAKIELNKNFKSLLSSKEVLKNKKLKTPYKIKNLIPGEYILNVSLDGYWPFEKKLWIEPGQTTYVENIVLLKKLLPLMIYSLPVQKIEIDDSFSNILFIENNELFDIKKESRVDLGESVGQIKILGNNKISVNDSLIFDLNQKTSFNLSDFSLEKNGNLKIIKNKIYYLNSKGLLFSYDYISKTNSQITDEERVMDYYVANDYLFLISEKDEKKYFKTHSLKNGEFIKNIELSSFGDYKINFVSDNSALVYDEKFSSLYIIDPFSKISGVKDVLRDVHDINFINQNSFIYYSGSEIRLFDLSISQSFLVSRFEAKITDLLWHPREYIIFSDGRSIKAIDFRYDKYITNLFTFDLVSNIVLDKSGGSLYFTGKIANQEGLYKLFIQ